MSVAAPARRRPRSPARPRPPVETRPAPATPRRRSRPRATRLRAGGVVWLVVVATLLGGIVAVQVEALRANIELGRLNQRAAQLGTANQTLAGQIAYLQNSARIDRFAEKAGMVRVVPPASGVLTLPAAGHRPARPAGHPQPAAGAAPAGRRPPR